MTYSVWFPIAVTIVGIAGILIGIAALVALAAEPVDEPGFYGVGDQLEAEAQAFLAERERAA